MRQALTTIDLFERLFVGVRFKQRQDSLVFTRFLLPCGLLKFPWNPTPQAAAEFKRQGYI